MHLRGEGTRHFRGAERNGIATRKGSPHETLRGVAHSPVGRPCSSSPSRSPRRRTRVPPRPTSPLTGGRSASPPEHHGQPRLRIGFSELLTAKLGTITVMKPGTAQRKLEPHGLVVAALTVEVGDRPAVTMDRDEGVSYWSGPAIRRPRESERPGQRASRRAQVCHQRRPDRLPPAGSPHPHTIPGPSWNPTSDHHPRRTGSSADLYGTVTPHRA